MNSLIIQNEPLSLSSPQQILAFSSVLKEYINKNNLAVTIQGNQYAMVDGWKFAGANFGLTALPEEPEPIHESGQYITILFKNTTIVPRDKNKKPFDKEVALFAGWTNHQTIINDLKSKHEITREIHRPYFAYKCKTFIERLSDGKVVGRGSSICTNLEIKKAEFDEYSVESMSQTRSIGKSYRNLIGYVMKSAGIEPTPAEEMDEVGERENAKPQAEQFDKRHDFNEGQYKKMIEIVSKGQRTVEDLAKTYKLYPEQVEDLKTHVPKPKK